MMRDSCSVFEVPEVQDGRKSLEDELMELI